MIQESKNIFILILILLTLAMGTYIIVKRYKYSEPNEALFDKRESCANNKENAKKQLSETYSLANSYFYDIFYSSKMDTCIYSYGLVLTGNPPDEMGSFVISDYFTGETFFSINYDNSSSDDRQHSYNVRPKYTEVLKNYRK